MKRATVLSIVCIHALVLPTMAIGDPAGPPGGLDVRILNTPLPVVGEVEATVTGEVEATVTGEVDATVTGDVGVTNFPAVQEVSGVVEVSQNLEAVFIRGATCPNRVDDRFGIDFDIPDGMVLVLENVTYEIVRCLGSETTPITTNQLSAVLESNPLGQFSAAEMGSGAVFIGRAFDKQVSTYHTSRLEVSVRVDPPDFVSGFFFSGYGRLVPGMRTFIGDD